MGRCSLYDAPHTPLSRSPGAGGGAQLITSGGGGDEVSCSSFKNSCELFILLDYVPVII